MRRPSLLPTTLPRLWIFLAVALPVLGSLLAALPAVDLAYHLRVGAEILATGRIPTTDTLTYTVAGRPWVDQQWGAEVILAAVYRAGGWTALAVLRAALVGTTFGLVALAIRGRNPALTLRTVALLSLAAFVVSVTTLALRPQLIGMALFAVTLVLIADRRDHPRRLWAIPVLVVVWANVHGSFVFGPVLLGLAWLEDLHEDAPRRHLALAVALVAAVAACVTPFGPGVWVYAAGLTTNPLITGRITEWQPTSLRDVPGTLFFASVAGVAALLARRRATTPWPALATLGLFAALGAYAVRGIAWWPLVAAVTAAGLLPPPVIPAREPRPQRLNAVIAGLLVVAGLGLLPAWRPVDPALHAPSGLVTNAPRGMTAALGTLARPGDRLWNPQPWGSWFEFALPTVPVTVDSRIELFPVSVWDDYVTVSSARTGWSEILDRDEVTIVVTATESNRQFEAALATDASWRRVHDDADGTIWVRADRPSVP